jgi:formamidopyrimidine-DNA glycosylase
VPELPEIETIRRHLAPHVEGRELGALEVLDDRWCRPLAPAELAAAVDGRRVERLSRRGKYLVWELEDDVFLLMHLRMTGTLLLDPPGAPPYVRVWLRLGDHTLAFSDPRRFGTGELALGVEARDAFFGARLGVEPLGEAFTTAHLHALARSSRAPVKAFLLDQKRIAGVGNIYADEALFRARIHPLRPANRLTRGQVDALREAVVASLNAGIAAKGATIDDFRDPYGVSGTFQDQFLVHTREGEPCPRCERPIRKLRAAGRGTYVCEGCQPRPRATATSRPRAEPRATATSRPRAEPRAAATSRARAEPRAAATSRAQAEPTNRARAQAAASASAARPPALST